MNTLTIVTSCAGTYGKYLREWAQSIVALTQQPGAVAIFTHDGEANRAAGTEAAALIAATGVPVQHVHVDQRLDFGHARNQAVALSATEWVMHLDCDDTIMPHALHDIAALAPDADVIGMGYERSGDLKSGPANKTRVYSSTTGLQALDAVAPCSGVSPFRRSLWERSPYRTDMLGAWDTALWIGFARLGARFRPTRRPCFWYRQHADSVFNKRRTTFDWTHTLTVAQLKSLRRNDHGVAVIIPRDATPSAARQAAFAYVRRHYQEHHPDWAIIEGVAPALGWCKGAAIADALTRCTAQIIVVADADCLVPPVSLGQAVGLVASGRAPWVVPHKMVHRLDAAETARALKAPFDFAAETPRALARKTYEGIAGGGIFVIKRAQYEATGGIPLAFNGWGGEDQAVAIILNTFVGSVYRLETPLFHLWHEPQASKHHAHGNTRLYRNIFAASRTSPARLWEVLRVLPNSFASARPVPPWKRRVAEQAGKFGLTARQQFLANQRRKAK